MKRSESLMVLTAAVFALTSIGCEPSRGEVLPNDATAQSDTPPAAGTTRRIPQFENADVRVWKTIIEPNQPLNLHRHDFGRVIVALKGGTLTVVPQSGERRKVVWETGHAYWLAADPPGEQHGDVNEGTEAIEVLVIEMRR